MIKQGTIDVATELTPAQINSLKGASGVNVIDIPGNYTLQLQMNNKIKPWDNKLVRQALNYAIDQKAIVGTAVYGYAKPMTSIGPSMYPNATPPTDFPYTYNPDKARQLLAEAGYANGFSVELSYEPIYPPDEVTATIIQSELAKVGITVTLKSTPASAFETQIYTYAMPFALRWMMPFHPDPYYGFSLMWRTGAFDNTENYFNPEVDKLIDQGLSITDPAARKEAGYVIQRTIMDDAPVVFMIQRDYTVAIRDNIVGWNWTTCQGTYYSKVSFK